MQGGLDTATIFAAASNLLAALVGGLIGGGFILLAQSRQRRSEMIAAGRATAAEMKNNAEICLSKAKTLPVPPFPFSQSVWLNQLPLIAQLLGWSELERLCLAYDRISSFQDNAEIVFNAERLLRDEPVPCDDNRWSGIKTQKGELSDLLARRAIELVEAVDLLSSKVLCTAERRRLKTELDGLKKSAEVIRAEILRDRLRNK